MTAQEFVYWLQGYCEIHGGVPNASQWKTIMDHLQLVLNKVTPNYGFPTYTPPAPYKPW